MKAIFFFDGNCTFCTEMAEYWKQNTDPLQIEFRSFHSYSEEELLTFHLGLTFATCDSNVQLISAGTRLPGFFAIRRMLFWSKKYRYIAPLLYLPLVPILGVATMYFLKYGRTTKL